MAESLMSKFNDATDYEFEYLLLKSFDVDVRAESIEVNLIYPEPHEQTVRANAQRISDAIISSLGSKAPVTVRLTKSHFDMDFFKKALLRFSESTPSISPYVFIEDMEIIQNAEYDFTVKLKMDEDVCVGSIFERYVESVKKMIATSYCEKISFEVVPVKKDDKRDIIAEREEELRAYVYQSTNGHYIIPQNVEEFVGKIIYDRAGYISDATREADGVVFCGTVSEFSECERKLKEGETVAKKFYKFTLTDPTGSLKCLHFPRKEESNIVLLKDGKQVVVKGSLKKNTFKGNTTYDMFVNSLSLCTLPTDIEIEQKPKFVAPKEYKKVFPEPYEERRQSTLFDVAKSTPAFLQNKRFCVFDIETTGLDTQHCKIIEIAGVIVENGHITQTFSTFVDPHVEIPAKITQLTSITDANVIGAPDISEALLDFYKFSDGTTLVGHNVNFDIGFLNAEGKPLGIVFENPKEDTFELARTYLKGLRNYKLSTVIKHLGVVNEHAHRAIYDTIATAKAFIKIAELM